MISDMSMTCPRYATGCPKCSN